MPVCFNLRETFFALISSSSLLLLLYGFIAVNGLKVLVENKVDFNKNKNVIVSAAMLVIGLGGAAISLTIKDFSLSISGMALAAIVGIILNVSLKEEN